jgi:hypothetical protein
MAKDISPGQPVTGSIAMPNKHPDRHRRQRRRLAHLHRHHSADRAQRRADWMLRVVFRAAPP